MSTKRTGVFSSSGFYDFPSPLPHRMSDPTGISSSGRLAPRSDFAKDAGLRGSLLVLLLVIACIAADLVGRRSAERPANSGAYLAGEARAGGVPNDQTLAPLW
jgi:hypothetical protein